MNRTEEQIKERIMLLIIEEMNSFNSMTSEPENVVPKFVESLTNKVTEIVIDEIAARRRF